MAKAIVFIDGGYFAKVLKNIFDEPDIDYELFSNKICGDAERIRTYYYDCMPYQSSPPAPEESRRYAEMDKFIYRLKHLNRFEVRLGRLQKIGEKFKQKGVDVLLSVDLVRLGWARQIDRAILVTGDSDFVPAIKAARDAGVVVIVYYSKKPPMYVHDELLANCDESYEITRQIIDSVLAHH